MTEKIGVVGLGYVGLPVAVALAEKFGDLVGFDISRERVSELSPRVRSDARDRFRTLDSIGHDILGGSGFARWADNVHCDGPYAH